jgi:hypothetical protein
MLGVRADRIDHEGQFVSVIDYASSVEGHTGPDVSFDKVMPINAQRVAVPQPRHLVRRAFRQREQEWLAQPVDLTATAGLAPRKFRICCRVGTASPPMSSTTKPGEMRSFYSGTDR